MNHTLSIEVEALRVDHSTKTEEMLALTKKLQDCDSEIVMKVRKFAQTHPGNEVVLKQCDSKTDQTTPWEFSTAKASAFFWGGKGGPKKTSTVLVAQRETLQLASHFVCGPKEYCFFFITSVPWPFPYDTSSLSIGFHCASLWLFVLPPAHNSSGGLLRQMAKVRPQDSTSWRRATALRSTATWRCRRTSTPASATR